MESDANEMEEFLSNDQFCNTLDINMLEEIEQFFDSIDTSDNFQNNTLDTVDLDMLEEMEQFFDSIETNSHVENNSMDTEESDQFFDAFDTFHKQSNNNDIQSIIDSTVSKMDTSCLPELSFEEVKQTIHSLPENEFLFQKGEGDNVQTNPSISDNEEETNNSAQENNSNSTFSILDPIEHNHFVLELMQSKSFKDKNVLNEYTYRVRPKYPAQEIPLNDLLPQLKGLFISLINEMRISYGNSSKVRVFIYHEELKKEIIVKPTFLGNLTSDLIIERIENVLYSAGFIPADEKLQINVACAQLKTIKGSGRKSIVNLDKDITAKRSLIRIHNTSDNLCLPRAIVVGLAHLQKKKNPQDSEIAKYYDKLRNSRISEQKVAAEELRQMTGIPLREGTLEDVKLYEKVIKKSIVVHSASAANERVYNGSEDYEDKIFLYHTENNGVGHFDTITKVNAMMCKQYYCNKCGKGFKNKTDHSCKEWCKVCGRQNCKITQQIQCKDCNKTCRSKKCFEEHKKTKTGGKGVHKGVKVMSYCDQFWECLECKVTLKRNERDISEHICGETKCKICFEYYHEENHYCYMRSISSNSNLKKFIFYDFECHQDTGKHIPNLVVAHSICSFCEDDPVNEFSVCNYCGSRCSKCNAFDKKENEFERNPCFGCGKRQIIFSGESTTLEFCQWLISPQHKDFTVIAHNARSYDAYFIYEYLLANSVVPDPIIFSGSKIMFMKIGRGLNIRMIDSLNFLPMSLAKLPKSFGFTEKKKGFFPHFFNTLENQNAVLPHLPDIKFYDPDSMSGERREEFLKWYNENCNKEFDFQKEMKEYCISDVDILLNACWRFRKLFMQETGEEIEVLQDGMLQKIRENSVDPLSFLTIASVCMGIFRNKFLPEKWLVLLKHEASYNCKHGKNCNCTWYNGRKLTGDSELEVLMHDEWISVKNLDVIKTKFVESPIGLIPSHGYSGSDNHSKESIQWLKVLEKQYLDRGCDIKIQNARSENGEKKVFYKTCDKIIQYRLDGYFELDGKKYACEYNGCNWHGCPSCYQINRDKVINNNKSLAQMYRDTMIKEKRLREMGFSVITKWSCEFAKDCRENEDVRDYVLSLNIQDPINVRDAFFGGRTNALVLHKKFNEGEQGHYVDYTSLYPDILKYQKFPTGHPKRIVQNFENPFWENCKGNCIYTNCSGQHLKLKYFGMIKATFLPPNNLLHPVLPVRCNGKLMFPLCFNCAVDGDIHRNCSCLDEERMFVGTYCTPEVEVAINMGYQILEWHEVLHWSEWVGFDSSKKSGGMFTDYINTFLKLKQQASGFPPDVKTEKEQNQYIRDYFEHEGILLDQHSIQKNPGLRSISKLALNSFYGKFGQRTNLKKTKLVTDIGQMYNLFLDETKQIESFHVINENILEIEFSHASEFEPMAANTNVVIASFCTSHARVKLWAEMNRLGSRVLYHDTDSIIYSVHFGADHYIPKTGSYLGQLTNELNCKDLGCSDNYCTGHWITEFVSCGPKNYAFKVNTGQVVCKVRGFTLNYQGSQKINFDSMKEALYAWKNKTPLPLVVVKTEIKRNKHKQFIYTNLLEKKYSVIYNKRKVLDDLTTVPFGYK